jgi:UDP-N-acetylmuramate dehydrogenase
MHMHIQKDVPLAGHTTLGVGGMARYFAEPETLEEMREALSFARDNTLPVQILGAGSNTLFSDSGWRGLVLRPMLLGKNYTEGARGHARVSVGAGEDWDALVAGAVSQGFWGLENLSFIPGSVGASPVQNIGAYGVSVSDVIEHVQVLDMRDAALHTLTPHECQFSYRDSFFKKKQGKIFLITEVTYALGVSGAPNFSYVEKRKSGYKDLLKYFPHGTDDVRPQDIRAALKEIRGSKLPDPKKIGTAGSFFKNPIISNTHVQELQKWLKTDIVSHAVDETHVKIPAGWLLDVCGFRGYRTGHVGTWPDHALAVVQYGGGTATEVLDFVRFLQKEVKSKTDIMLEPEVQIVGE